MEKPQLKIIFRKFRHVKKGQEPEIIALFPELAANSDYMGYCDSYMHLGQHSPASIYLTRTGITSAATSSEYSSLLRELEQIYNTHEIIIIQRFPHNVWKLRKADYYKSRVGVPA